MSITFPNPPAPKPPVSEKVQEILDKSKAKLEAEQAKVQNNN